MTRVLVTGGTGFVGRRAVPLLLGAGHEVVGLARSDGAAAELERMGAQFVAGDLDDRPGLIDAFESAGAQALVNIASLGFGHAPAIVEAATRSGTNRAIFVSTTAIFTKLNAGSKSVRVSAEATITDSSLDYTIIRPTMIYGAPDDRNLARLLQVLKRTTVMPVPGSKRLQQPVHVEDVAASLVAALDNPETIGRIYDVAGPTAITFREVVEEAADAVSRRVLVVPVPLRPVVALTRAYERWARHPRLKAEQFERLGEDKAFDISPAVRDLGYQPRPFAVGIRDEADQLLSRQG
jgi:uncharacterized protein YbjT (DUF2867 family)